MENIQVILKNTHKKRIHKVVSIIMTFLILFISITQSTSANLLYINAKTAFEKSKPLGIMATAVGKKVVVSWEAVDDADGYEIYESVLEYLEDGTVTKTKFTLVKDIKKCQAVLSKKKQGAIYRYYVRAYQIKENLEKNTTQEEKSQSENEAASKTDSNVNKVYSKSSKKVSTTVSLTGKSTIKNFLQTAISPIGSTMYVWGGGWNKEDTAAGPGATRIGLSVTWRNFAKKQTASYNYKNYRYQINNGLDCSGFVGWSVYNVLNTKKNQKGYVYSSKKQAKKFSNFGFGSYRTAKKVSDYKAGDIMSSTCSDCGHVWIVLGQCKDKSVVLVHASPSGVQISGTVTPKGKQNSQAYKLAKKYMEKYYPEWTKKYPALCKNTSYLTHYSQMRWTTKGNEVVLSDPDGYQDMSAEEVLKDLFSNVE